MGIAQKEINETICWLKLMKSTDYLSKEQFESLNADAVEIMKIVISIFKNSQIQLTINGPH
jgi:four helix bundle protein